MHPWYNIESRDKQPVAVTFTPTGTSQPNVHVSAQWEEAGEPVENMWEQTNSTQKDPRSPGPPSLPAHLILSCLCLSSPGGVRPGGRDGSCFGAPLGPRCPGGSGPHVPQSVCGGDELVLRGPGCQRLSGPDLGGPPDSPAGGLSQGECVMHKIMTFFLSCHPHLLWGQSATCCCAHTVLTTQLPKSYIVLL